MYLLCVKKLLYTERHSMKTFITYMKAFLYLVALLATVGFSVFWSTCLAISISTGNINPDTLRIMFSLTFSITAVIGIAILIVRDILWGGGRKPFASVRLPTRAHRVRVTFIHRRGSPHEKARC